MIVVRYKGGAESACGGYGTPAALEKGALYEVELIDAEVSSTSFYLAGLPGRFSSSLFEKVAENTNPATVINKKYRMTA